MPNEVICKWERLKDGVWIGARAGVPIAYVKRLRKDLFAYKCVGPTGISAEANVANYTTVKTLHDAEQTLRDLGWQPLV